MAGNVVYHLEFHDRQGRHYFGSIAAIYDIFTPKEVGVSKSRLWAYKIEEGKPYRNRVCVIYRGEVRRKRNGNLELDK